MRTSRAFAIGLLASVLGLAGLSPRQADACENSVAAARAARAWLARDLVQDEDQFLAHLLRAEEQLRLNHLPAASDELDLIERRIELGSPRMRGRFWRNAALLTVRTLGVWPQVVSNGAKANSPRQRAKALERAVAQLRSRALGAPNDPIRSTDLAEALATLPKYHQEARQVLERLALADLVTSAHAYAALAKLRRAAGDPAGASLALDSCRKLAATGTVCAADVRPSA